MEQFGLLLIAGSAAGYLIWKSFKPIFAPAAASSKCDGCSGCRNGSCHIDK